VGRGLRLGGQRRLDFGGGNDVAWLRAFGLALLGAKPFSGVDLWLSRRGRGLVSGWREPAVRDEAFDGYDHRKCPQNSPMPLFSV
jgi:hypothetical protein